MLYILISMSISIKSVSKSSRGFCLTFFKFLLTLLVHLVDSEAGMKVRSLDEILSSWPYLR